MALKPWREVVTPHENVLKGTFQESEFAADLSKVAAGTSSPEYQDPELFFERTFVTEGMRLLLDSVIRRLTARGGDPVVQLQTAFGGGKTHAMLAVYHLAKSGSAARKYAGLSDVFNEHKKAELPAAAVAVLDGNALSPSHPRKHGKVTTRTLWGEMAWQLGGDKGYKLVAESDADGTSPGKDVLAGLFEGFGPCVVLLDEAVAYVRQFEEGKKYAGGTFDSNISFIQALTEAAKNSPSTVVLASLPESNLEVGGVRGQQALKKIDHVFSRLHALWKPVATEEGFEIVRRRLFGAIGKTKDRDEVCDAFAEMYHGDDSFPADARKSAYRDRLVAAYPFHPELFDRLYTDWASLQNFQRTRGVLRLMAMVVHKLWSDDNRHLMIMPGSLPLYGTQVRNELVKYLPQGWEPVVEKDVDGSRSVPTEIDEKNPMLGQVQACRRVARTIFLASSPAGTGQKLRGLNSESVYLGCCQPGEQQGRFEDALRRMTDQLHHLYYGNQRYWYDTQHNLLREAEDRISRFQNEYPSELERRLKGLLKAGKLGGLHVFTPHADVPDDPTLRLVVLSPTTPHQWHVKDSAAIRAAAEYVEHRGDGPRSNQNRLLFLAADADTVDTLVEQACRYMAWNSIVEDTIPLNLDQHRVKEANRARTEAESRLKGVVVEAYKWLLAPVQTVKDGQPEATRWEEVKANYAGRDPMDVVLTALKENECVITEWSPFHLQNVLQQWYWSDDRQDYPLHMLWADFCRYLYLPRLFDQSVLQRTVENGLKKREFFGYAQAKRDNGYSGLSFGSDGPVTLDGDSVVLSVEEATAHYEVAPTPDRTPKRGSEREVGPAPKDDTPAGRSDHAIPLARPTRFHASVTLDPVKGSLEFAKIMEEVVQHFSSELGTRVDLRLEIEASSEPGFDQSTVRTVKENSKALGFDHGEFEVE